ncbi:MAG: RIP metalloprotease RseP [Rhizomicrobium sp.]|jgi:regulator of sigma E protease
MLNVAQGAVIWLVHYVVPFLLLITPVVFFHELGHFLVARAFGVRVETFSIGFGPAIVSWHDRKKTLWKISWIPLGGYVKFFGDLNAASMPDQEQLEKIDARDRAEAFPFKPVYQRALIVAAGPFANFILAIAIFTAFLLTFGTDVAVPVVNSVVHQSAAEAAGIHKGDVILSVAGQPIEHFDDIRTIVWDRAGQSLPIDVRRGKELLHLHITPRSENVKEMGIPQKVGRLGISAPQFTHISYGPISAVTEACRRTWSVVTTTFDFVFRRYTFQLSTDQLRGPIGVAQVSAQVASVSYLALVQLAALISISLGVVNLFPIPVLDGGHLLYYGCEALMGRPLGARAQDVGFRLGLAFMLGFFLFVTWNDVARLFKP